MREDLLRARAAVRQLQRRSSTLTRRTGENFVLPPASTIMDAEVGGGGGDRGGAGITAPLLVPVRGFCSLSPSREMQTCFFFLDLTFPKTSPTTTTSTQQTAAALLESLRPSSGYLSPRIVASVERRRTGSFGGGGGSPRRVTSTSCATGGGGAVTGASVAPGLVAPLSDVQALTDMLLSSYFNFLLVCVPLGWAAELLKWGAVPIFFLNITALIPLALVLGQLTEDLALRYGERGGGGSFPYLRRCVWGGWRIV